VKWSSFIHESCHDDLILIQGFKTLEKAAVQLKNLPKEYEDFYLRRMIISLQQRLEALAAEKGDTQQ